VHPQSKLTLRISFWFKLALLVLGAAAVLTRLWACEDAYISFRYVENLLDGHGLVYNIGERVEGFTHPLWLLLITPPTALGLPVRLSALSISLLFTLITFYLVLFEDRKPDGNPVLLPLAPVLFITHTGFRDFSVSGLEFPLTALLLTMFLLSYKRSGLLAKPRYHGALLAFLYLTHPEMILLAVVLYARLAAQWVGSLRQGKSSEARLLVKDALSLSLPIVLLAGGYHLFRSLYYAELFPNTYFAKAGLGAYWSQGWAYFLHFWRYSPVLLASLLSAIALYALQGRFRSEFHQKQERVTMLLLAVVLSLYVVRLGGDFMAYRFLLPVLVILAILWNDLLDHLLTTSRSVAIGSVTMVALSSLLLLDPINAPQREGHISDERQYYDLYHPPLLALFEEPEQHRWYKAGLALKEWQQETQYPVAHATINIGYLGYAAGSGVRIVDAYGLTDREVARNWGVRRGRERPGHEMKLSLSMAIEKRVTFWGSINRIWDGMMTTPFGTIITLDPSLLRYFPENVQRLKQFKEDVLAGRTRAPNVMELLRTLEAEYGVRVEHLRVEATPRAQPR